MYTRTIFMEDNGIVQTQQPTDPLEPWKTSASLMLGFAIAVLLTKILGSIFLAILLFFPIKRIFNGLLFNQLQTIASGVLLLFLWPVLQGSSPLLAARLQPLTAHLPAAIGTAMLNAALITLFLILLVTSIVLSHLLPAVSFPRLIHRSVMTVSFALTLVLGLTATVIALQYCNGKYIQLPSWLNISVPAIAALIGIIAFIKVCKLIFSNNTEKSAIELAERPNTKLADVAGMEEVKSQIRLRLIEPIRNPAAAKKYGLKTGGGVLLYGPPGTGKTFLARAVAGELNLPFFMVTAADVFSKYVGESENKIRELFNTARKHPLSVIFIDEMEIIFAKRTDSIHETTQKVISVILQELDGVDQNKNPILILGATNTPWKIDEAFLRPGRFDILAFVDLPDAPARMQILQSAFKNGTLPYEKGLLEYITQNTNSYSGADLNGLVTRIRQQAYDRREKLYTRQLSYEILQKTTPSTNREICENIRNWEKERQKF